MTEFPWLSCLTADELLAFLSFHQSTCTNNRQKLTELDQGSQTHLGVRATLQDITQSAGRIVFRDDKMQ